MTPTERDVLAAMSTVIDPELRIDLVKASMVKDVKVQGDSVAFTIELTTPACPAKDQIKKEAEAALSKAGITKFAINWSAKVRAAPPGVSKEQLLPGVKNVVLVGAGKGGVGKSTVSINLACGLAKLGASVGLLDADFYGPSIPIMTGLNRRPVSPDGKTLEPLEAHGIKVMSIGFLIEPDQALVWRGPMLHGALTQLVRDVRWGELDYLILDLPPGTGDVVLSMSQQVRAAGAVLVTTPQDVSLADVVRARQMFEKVNVPVLGLVENMSLFVCPNCQHSTDIFSHGGGKKAADMMGISYFGELPIELAIRKGSDEGLPVVVGSPDTPAAKRFLELARAVAGRVSQENHRVRLPVMSAAS